MLSVKIFPSHHCRTYRRQNLLLPTVLKNKKVSSICEKNNVKEVHGELNFGTPLHRTCVNSGLFSKKVMFIEEPKNITVKTK